VICHGSSNGLAIKNAVKVAAGLHTFGFEGEIRNKVERAHEKISFENVGIE
jgi:fatty acid/phospholipid biosynthesis enzyme